MHPRNLNGPITQNLETESGASPLYPNDGTQGDRADRASNITKHINRDHSVGKNQALPWVVIAIVAVVACTLSGMAIGLAAGTRDLATRTESRAVESAKLAEREMRLLRLEVDELKVALQVQGIKVHEGVKP